MIFLSANYTEDKHRVLGLELGADDYILKPFNAKELVTKVKSLLTHKEFLEKLRAENKQLLKEQRDYGKRLEELEKRTQKLQKDVFIDETTGLYNGSYFLQRLNEEYYRSLRYTHELGVVVIDIDYFNQIDKEYGKKASEYILMKVVNIILNNTRNSDVVFRIDTNKFGIILPNTDETGAFQEAERIRKAIDQTKVIDKELIDLNLITHQRKHGIKNITTSIGITSLTEEIKKPEDLVKEVESALEKARNEGHNVTIKHSQLIKR